MPVPRSGLREIAGAAPGLPDPEAPVAVGAAAAGCSGTMNEQSPAASEVQVKVARWSTRVGVS